MTADSVSPLWIPSAERVRATNLRDFAFFLEDTGRSYQIPGDDKMLAWSLAKPEEFWEAVAAYYEVKFHDKPTAVLGRATMPGAEWFPGATLNYAEHALCRRDNTLAVIACDESGRRTTLSYAELIAAVARAQAGLAALGISRGDRLAALAPNSAETLVLFLACAGLGAIWSSCAPEFGVRSVLDRFQQIEPKILVAVRGYRFDGKVFDRSAAVAEIRAGLPGLRAVIELPGVDEGGGKSVASPSTASGAVVPPQTDLSRTLSYAELLDLASPGEGPRFEAVPFAHPLYILYSSGTTGLPKPIVHGHGGILLEHLKALGLHGDIKPGERFFWYTTTGWMMWNYLVSGLLVGATVVLYDGSVKFPHWGALWDLAAREGVRHFGVSASYLLACAKEDLHPGQDHDLSALRMVGSTGSPLPPEGFRWVYERVKADVHLASVSGGTDVCTAFVLGWPTKPVYAGEIQGRGLGCAVEAFGPDGGPVPMGEVGELVLTKPLPSMPVSFWNDPEGRRYRESYFDVYPGVWRHGDWIQFTPRGGCIITGRSDSTLNRGGVRMGTSEFYSVVEALPEVADSLVIDTGALGREDALWLFVVPRPGVRWDADAEKRVRSALRSSLSPRHVPDFIRAVPTIPRTLNGKKVEVPIKRLLLGADPAKVLHRDTLANPTAVDVFVEIARHHLESRR